MRSFCEARKQTPANHSNSRSLIYSNVDNIFVLKPNGHECVTGRSGWRVIHNGYCKNIIPVSQTTKPDRHDGHPYFQKITPTVKETTKLRVLRLTSRQSLEMRTKSSQSNGNAPSSLVVALLFGLSCTTFLSFYLDLLSNGAYNHNPIERALQQAQPFNSKAELLRRLYPNETAIPNPPLSDGKSTFSGCLLVMDDNHRLTEWLAYHYHVLPLRYLVVAVDPRSETSPTHIFNRWRRYGMAIVEWSDADFWLQQNGQTLRDLPANATFQNKRDRHRGRQKYFYKKCLIHMKEKQRTWVSLHDSDEYMVYNHAGGAQFEEWDRSRRIRDPKRMRPSQTPPTTAEQGGMIRYIQQEQAAGLEYYQSPCIGIPRLMFGADTDKIDTRATLSNVPPAFHSLVPSMDTLYWRQHALRNDFGKNALGKVILDVSRVDVARTPAFKSLHRPIKKICASPWHKDGDSGLRINHYLGSWESYSFRDNDSRRGGERSWEQWEFKATTLEDTTDDVIRPWVSGLVKAHGEDVALKMLANVGLPSTYHPHNKHAWRLQPDKLEQLLQVDHTTSHDNKLLEFAAWLRDKYLPEGQNEGVHSTT